MSSLADGKNVKDVKHKCILEEELFCQAYARLYSENKHIPEDIIHFLIMCYRLFEEWAFDCKGKYISLSKSSIMYFNDICECQSMDGYQSVFGINKVNKGYHHWTLKLLNLIINPEKIKVETSWRIIVGIFDASSSYNGYQFVWNCAKKNENDTIDTVYGLGKDLQQNKYNQYGAIGKTGHIIDIYLDFNKQTLSFGINGKNYGVAFSEIPQKTYRLAITLTGKGTSMQIVSYVQSKNEI